MDAWLAANVEAERDPRRLLDGVAAAMRAIRVRSEASLGAGAASVIFERIVANASGGGALDGFSLDQPSSPSRDVDRDAVLEASRELLVDTLVALSSLTNDALTTALHAELAAAAPPDRAPPPPRSARQRRGRP